MLADNFEETLKLQEEFRARLLESAEALRAEKAPSRKLAIKEREALIARTRLRLENAVKDRDAIVQNWDQRIARLEAEVDALTADVKDLTHPAPEEKESGGTQPKRTRKKRQP